MSIPWSHALTRTPISRRGARRVSSVNPLESWLDLHRPGMRVAGRGTGFVRRVLQPGPPWARLRPPARMGGLFGPRCGLLSSDVVGLFPCSKSGGLNRGRVNRNPRMDRGSEGGRIARRLCGLRAMKSVPPLCGISRIFHIRRSAAPRMVEKAILCLSGRSGPHNGPLRDFGDGYYRPVLRPTYRTRLMELPWTVNRTRHG